jgi:O-Antigen ligase
VTHQPLRSSSAFGPFRVRGLQRRPTRSAATRSLSGDELCLKLLVATLFLPEGLSFFIGDFRLSLTRVLIIIFSITAVFRRVITPGLIFVPSDVMAPAAAVWMMLAGTVTGGLIGLKGAGIDAIEFAGSYYVFRHLLGPIDSSVRVISFACKVMILVVGIALLDPLTGKLFTYEFVKEFTGYVKQSYEEAIALHQVTVYRNGVIRAMGPLEHSIMFGTVCVWFGTLAFITFPSRLFGWSIAGVALIGVWFSQARGPLLGYIVAFALAIFYVATKQFAARWKVIGLLAFLATAFIFSYSRSPIATLMRLFWLDPETGWYRQAIWDTALPLVIRSPIFGTGSSWDWQAHGILVSSSVDAFWLMAAMRFGIPGSVLIFLTMVGAFWLGPLDKSRHLSHEEMRLSLALGILVATAVFLGFTVHFWGTCWILLGAFPGMRANLAEAAVLRRGASLRSPENRARSSRLSQIPPAAIGGA